MARSLLAHHALSRRFDKKTSFAHPSLRGLLSLLAGARADERLRIARELHEELGSTLTALKLELSGNPQPDRRPGATRPRVRRASVELVDRVLNALQGVIAGLRPDALEHCDLWEAIRLKAREFEALTKAVYHIDMPGDLPQPAEAVATAIYRVVEEALTNAVRHAGARSVHLQVWFSESKLQLEISDDGCGISGSQKADAHSFGLRGMQERAHQIGAHVHVSCGLVRGTRVRLSIPLECIHDSNED